MKDRVPTPGQEGRVKITPESGGAAYYAKIEMADNPTQLGDEPIKANLLPDDVASALGLTGNPQVADALKVASPWRLIGSYTAAGSFIFNVPDGLQELGAFVIGGGGGGASVARWRTIGGGSSGYDAATGGSSGCTNVFYSNGILESSYPVVVGAGGLGGDPVTPSGYNPGSIGGSSSFGGVVALGGCGGLGVSSEVSHSGVYGGQGASTNPGENRKAPAFGEIRMSVGSNNIGTVYQYTTFPGQSRNPFDGRRVLIAGGYARAGYNQYQTQTASDIIDDYGNYGSSGAGSGENGNAYDIPPAICIKGTSYGCGGGSAASSGRQYEGGIYKHGYAQGAPGCDGAVLIYGR